MEVTLTLFGNGSYFGSVERLPETTTQKTLKIYEIKVFKNKNLAETFHVITELPMLN